ncbi:MAG: exo-alpha-sialidase [Clostridia bacterium]|nr:exo-alpha-sialidase [Clostridia bacterium]
MKKITGIIFSIILILNTVIIVSAADYVSPFDTGTLSVERYRIPALYTLNDGSVLASADMRYNHGTDAPHNIDIAIAISKDGYANWNYQVLNHFDDYKDGVSDSGSASYIDSAVVQSKNTGRIFIVCDTFPTGGGYNQALKGTGFTEINGRKYMLLTDGENTDKLSTFNYYIGEFSKDFADIFTRSGEKTSYSVDAEYRLYKNSQPLYITQNGGDKRVQQNVFYNASELCCYLTSYLTMKYSDDNGKTWSNPINLSAQIKNENEGFLGIAPGRGFVTEYKGKERIIFAVYDNAGISENVSTIYSDDNGVTWHRGEETDRTLSVMKTSEAQIVDLGNKLRMYARNNYCYVSYADSTDGGITWSEFKSDYSLSANGNCMSSFINTDKKVDGKPVILASFPSDNFNRANGVIKTGLITDGDVEWIATYNLNDGFCAYSCMTQLSDGNIAILYEDEAAHLDYKILTINENGKLSEINGENIGQKETSFFNKVLDFITRSFGELLNKILNDLFGFLISVSDCVENVLLSNSAGR